jgi:dTDP-4-dehydrorhamnose 3,5-epimerase
MVFPPSKTPFETIKLKTFNNKPLNYYTNMKFTETPLPGGYLIDLEPHTDDRGFFSRYFCEKEFGNYSLNIRWVQINDSLCKETGTLRGVHFQYPPYTETKLIRCIRGAIWDVIVDIRAGSSTYGKWFGAELNDNNRTMMYVPEGFAHGFISLKPDSEIIYLVSKFYSQGKEQSILWSDPSIAIQWPLTPKVISSKDAQAPKLSEIAPLELESNIVLNSVNNEQSDCFRR